MVQHFPWPSWSFDNRSIVLHGLKGPGAFWAHASRASSGPFEPINRTCGTCAEMGWSTWPGSVVNGWRCCGERVRPKRAIARKKKAASRTVAVAAANPAHDHDEAALRPPKRKATAAQPDVMLV